MSLLLILFLGVLPASCGSGANNTDDDTSATTPLLKVTIEKNGSVTSQPAGIDCGDDCSEKYAKDSIVELTAKPEKNYLFSHWSGDCSGSENPLTVTLDKERECSAIFSNEVRTLTVTVASNGKVTSDPSGIDCGSDCDETYAKNTSVKLTATADNHYELSSWGGDCSGSANPLTVTMDKAKSCSATFNHEVSTLTITKTGNGKVTGSGIDCGSDCSEGYPEGKHLQLTATADKFHKLSSWGGDCSGSGKSVSVTIDGAKTCSARFIRIKLTDTGQTKSYTDTYGEDSDYTIDTPSFITASNSEIVTDNKTGLVWQKNGRDKCTNSKIKCTWEEAKAHCKNLQLQGRGWRLPDLWELQSIINYDKYNQAIDGTFSNTVSGEYWSSTADSYSGYSWMVDFASGLALAKPRSKSYNVRCVRGEPLPLAAFKDNKDGTVTDLSTGLTWQQKDDNTKRLWKDALTYCENLEWPANSGQKDWRLPNIKELSSIADRSRNEPSIDITFFSETESSYYWSSTIHASNPSNAWYVHFGGGSVLSNGKDISSYVRCVRGGQ